MSDALLLTRRLQSAAQRTRARVQRLRESRKSEATAKTTVSDEPSSTENEVPLGIAATPWSKTLEEDESSVNQASDPFVGALVHLASAVDDVASEVSGSEAPVFQEVEWNRQPADASEVTHLQLMEIQKQLRDLTAKVDTLILAHQEF